MQSTYARNCGLALLAPLTGPEEPQAAIADADPTRRSTTNGSGRGIELRLYRRAGNSAVTVSGSTTHPPAGRSGSRTLPLLRRGEAGAAGRQTR
jgi:hypothetical protein